MALILVRMVGEIGVKGKNRGAFVKRLRRNMRDALKKNGISGRVWSENQRAYVEVEEDDRQSDPVSAAVDALRRVFGIASLSPVSRVASDIDAIRAEALSLVERAGLTPDKSYRVVTRRADKSFPLTSPEVNLHVGSAIGRAIPARVDLSDKADLTVGIEIRQEGTTVYGQIIPGPGGMPLGTQGRAFVLLSGGIDSPVAAWLMMRRGCGIIPLHFSQSEVEESKAMANCELLSQWSFGWEIKPIVVSHHEVLAPVAEKLYQIGEARWTCLLCKRAMIAKAIELAPQYRVQAIIMGDSLGQVASQTLDNMAAITWGATLPILRPLIAYDKDQITALARQIGSFGISTGESAPCPFLPPRPLTRAHLDQLQEILAQLEE
jgi:thiamine biosynthesis protein ThiI